jgi:uncharacterized membrane protein YeaQ/YmgE (transglycosylase-associated protein family)
MESHGKELPINPFIVCGVGAAVGFVAGPLMGTRSKIIRIEEVLVAIFGAFIGGDFLLTLLEGEAAKPSFFSIQALGMGIAGAGVLLLLLHLMRGAVGPLQSKKSKVRQR